MRRAVGAGHRTKDCFYGIDALIIVEENLVATNFIVSPVVDAAQQPYVTNGISFIKLFDACFKDTGHL